MTVCLAATYENGKGVVLASDQMVTAHFPIGYEFEHEETTKIVPMSNSVDIYALVAGDVLKGQEIIGAARVQAQTQDVTTAAEIAELVRACYQQTRLTHIVRTELEPRGLDINSYYNNQQRLLPQVVQVVDQVMCQTDLGVQIIIAGPGNGQYTIHTVTNPGVVNDNSPIGHSAIGSGAPHAIYSLIEAPYMPSLDKNTVLEMVKAAKRRSQVAPGVGASTRIIAIPQEEVEECTVQ